MTRTNVPEYVRRAGGWISTHQSARPCQCRAGAGAVDEKLAERVGNPVNVIDIDLTVDGVKGLTYPRTIAACP